MRLHIECVLKMITMCFFNERIVWMGFEYIVRGGVFNLTWPFPSGRSAVDIFVEVLDDDLWNNRLSMFVSYVGTNTNTIREWNYWIARTLGC